MRARPAPPVSLSAVPPGSLNGKEWPGDLLDVDLLTRSGWRSAPFRQFVLKIHSRCNLSCSYCYVYSMADTSWRTQPTIMSTQVVARSAERVAEHAERHRLPAVTIVLHGGEPLLAGPAFIAELASVFRSTIRPETTVSFALQTNGTLLNEEFLDVFARHDVRVGVSLDGGAQRDLRRYAHGGSSHADAVRGLDLLRSPAGRPLFAGILSVVDLERHPVDTYEELLAFEPPLLDLNLPHAHWSAPPPSRPGAAGPDSAAATPYADWFIALFDRWFDADRHETVIRLFDEIIRLLLGGRSRTEAIGLTPSSVVVIETDGSLEQVDALKSAYDGAAATGLHIDRDSFDDALALPSIVARQIGSSALPDDCHVCPVLSICGGGFYPHRYRAGTGFRNRSVYCPDLIRLIDHVRMRVGAGLARAGADRP
ncbi:MAG: FxsB family cyclophane-forming radical SAM/SPASM peptide maturase [Frankia sp.]